MLLYPIFSRRRAGALWRAEGEAPEARLKTKRGWAQAGLFFPKPNAFGADLEFQMRFPKQIGPGRAEFLPAKFVSVAAAGTFVAAQSGMRLANQ